MLEKQSDLTTRFRTSAEREGRRCHGNRTDNTWMHSIMSYCIFHRALSQKCGLGNQDLLTFREKCVCAHTRTCAYAHIARSTGMKNTTSKLCNLEIATPKINGAKVATVETKGAKHLSSFCFFPISSCSLPKPLEGVNVQICRNYPATPTIDTSHQLRLTLNWVSHLQLTYYCNISIYLLCMCIHTYLHAHPVGSRFSPSCGF